MYLTYCFTGFALVVRHLRPDGSCGNGYRELKPIDQNLQYDFNFQQVNHLTEEVNLKPVSIIIISYIY